MAETHEEWLHSRLRDLLETGRRQLAQGNHAAAADTFRTALRVLPTDADPDLRLELLELLAEADPGEATPLAAAPIEKVEVPAPVAAKPVERVETVPPRGPIEPPKFALLAPEEEQDSEEWRFLLNVVVALLGIPVVLFAAFLIGRVASHPVARPVAFPQRINDVKPDAIYLASLPLASAVAQAEQAGPEGDTIYFAPIKATLPVLLSTSKPAYTKEALRDRCEGVVRVHVKIGAGGKVSDPQVLQGLGCGLDFQALKSVMEWQFRPGQLDGKAIAVVAWVEVSFRLP